jgi:hypothetical protein
MPVFDLTPRLSPSHYVCIIQYLLLEVTANKKPEVNYICYSKNALLNTIILKGVKRRHKFSVFVNAYMTIALKIDSVKIKYSKY